MGATETEPEVLREYFNSYKDYNHTLRAWFVGFGIGGPVVFLVNAPLLDALIKSGQMICVATLFLVGVGAQIIVSFLNKVSSWTCYHGYRVKSFQTTKRYKAMLWLQDQFWIDVILDLCSIGVFVGAVLVTLGVLIQ
ncbi:MAG: hypothetical protein IH886_15210 [Nitrospinae bacterium]|nr:hypothetical protein [Nitrospinota bacterium]